MSIPANLDVLPILVVTKCRSFTRARWMQPADFDDFVQTVNVVVLHSRTRAENTDTPLDVVVDRAVWSVYKAITRDRERQNQLVAGMTSQAKAAKPVKTETPAEQQEFLAKVIAVAEANLTETELRSIKDPDSLRATKTPGAIRTEKCRAKQKLRNAAAVAGLLSLLVTLGFLIGFLIACRSVNPQGLSINTERRASQRGGAEASAFAGIQSCRASEGTEAILRTLAGSQSCRASQRGGAEASAFAGIQSCRASQRSGIDAMSIAGIQSC